MPSGQSVAKAGAVSGGRDGCGRGGAAAVGAYLDFGLGRDRQIELGAVGELGENPPDPLAAGPGPVPQHVDERAQIRQRRDDHRFRRPPPPGASLAALGVDAVRGVDVGERVGRAAAQRAADQQRRHQRPGLAPIGQPS